MKHFILSIAAFGLCFTLGAQSLRPEVDINFQTHFLNDEFAVSGCELNPSGTMAAVRLAPYAGLCIGEHHKVKLGLDVVKDFGIGTDKPIVDLACWYQYNNEGFTFAAGVLPFGLMSGYYSTAIFSDAARFYDAHLDGFLLKWEREMSHYEIALDWCGKYGEDRREEFYFLSSGAGWVTDWLGLCWEGVFHHLACSENAAGVFDDHLFHPYVRFEFSSLLPVMERMELSLGGMVGYQMDREQNLRYIPKGADVVVDVRKWGFGVRNQFYYGQSQAPLYDKTIVGDALYFRAPWWQIRKDGKAGIYDRLDAYWMKSLGKYVDVGVHAVFHFDYLGIMGFQQLVQANFSLEGLFNKKD